MNCRTFSPNSRKRAKKPLPPQCLKHRPQTVQSICHFKLAVNTIYVGWLVPEVDPAQRKCPWREICLSSCHCQQHSSSGSSLHRDRSVPCPSRPVTLRSANWAAAGSATAAVASHSWLGSGSIFSCRISIGWTRIKSKSRAEVLLSSARWAFRGWVGERWRDESAREKYNNNNNDVFFSVPYLVRSTWLITWNKISKKTKNKQFSHSDGVVSIYVGTRPMMFSLLEMSVLTRYKTYDVQFAGDVSIHVATRPMMFSLLRMSVFMSLQDLWCSGCWRCQYSCRYKTHEVQFAGNVSIHVGCGWLGSKYKLSNSVQDVWCSNCWRYQNSCRYKTYNVQFAGDVSIHVGTRPIMFSLREMLVFMSVQSPWSSVCVKYQYSCGTAKPTVLSSIGMSV